MLQFDIRYCFFCFVFMGFIPAKQRAKRELARIWRLPRGSNTPPLWGELAKKKLSHAPLLAAGYLTKFCGLTDTCNRRGNGVH
jgi:hypothetical protein